MYYPETGCLVFNLPCQTAVTPWRFMSAAHKHYKIHVNFLTHLSGNSCPSLLVTFSVLSVKALKLWSFLLPDCEELKGYLHGMRECRPFFLFLPWEEWERERKTIQDLSPMKISCSRSLYRHISPFMLSLHCYSGMPNCESLFPPSRTPPLSLPLSITHTQNLSQAPFGTCI